MSGGCTRGGEQQQVMVSMTGAQVSGGGDRCFSFYHVPQQCRREKLRVPNADERPPPWQIHTPPFHSDPTASSSPPSFSHVPNPSSNNTAPYDHGLVNPVNLLDHHPVLFGGAHYYQGCQGISLSLSSAALGQAACAPALIGQLPPETAVPPRTGQIPTGPFTGYAAILKGSRFLRPAQQLLEEACGGSGSTVGAMVYSHGELESLDLAADDCGGGGGETRDGVIGGGEHQKMKSRLISMLDEVCRRYKQYCQQIQAVVTSFDAVEGLNMAASYTPLALGSLSKHFKYIKNAISDQLQSTNKALGKEGQRKGEMPGLGVKNGGFCYERVAHGLGAIDPQPVWRPQRGLPECAVAMLRAWLFDHFLHPYPTDMDKQMLAKQTGLSRNQVSNWFINARVRLWKPMVEEIHYLELQQAHKIPETDCSYDTNKHPKFSSTSTVNPNNKQIPLNVSSQKIPDHPHKPLCDELPQLPNHIKEPVNFSGVDLSTHHHVGITAGFASGAASGSISLTLGLQNEGVCLPEPLPLNVVQRFGLEGSSAAYIMGGFEGQERHLAKEFDGEFLRRFVA